MDLQNMGAKPGMPGMGLEMPGDSQEPVDVESKVADLESRISALEELMKSLGGGATTPPEVGV